MSPRGQWNWAPSSPLLLAPPLDCPQPLGSSRSRPRAAPMYGGAQPSPLLAPLARDWQSRSLGLVAVRPGEEGADCLEVWPVQAGRGAGPLGRLHARLGEDGREAAPALEVLTRTLGRTSLRVP